MPFCFQRPRHTALPARPTTAAVVLRAVLGSVCRGAPTAHLGSQGVCTTAGSQHPLKRAVTSALWQDTGFSPGKPKLPETQQSCNEVDRPQPNMTLLPAPPPHPYSQESAPLGLGTFAQGPAAAGRGSDAAGTSYPPRLPLSQGKGGLGVIPCCKAFFQAERIERLTAFPSSPLPFFPPHQHHT